MAKRGVTFTQVDSVTACTLWGAVRMLPCMRTSRNTGGERMISFTCKLSVLKRGVHRGQDKRLTVVVLNYVNLAVPQHSLCCTDRVGERFARFVGRTGAAAVVV